MADGVQILRRNRPGSKAKDFCRWPDEPFEEMDSTLAVQQFIQQTIRRDPANLEAILKMPEAQDEGVWKYEHLRQFCMELNGLAVRLQSECKPETCTQMTATEQWIFLCAAHKTPKECPAIDYTRHTLDGAACLLNSNKYFPSRVSIKESSVAKLGSVCRRVYRIFSHAYFHHRSIFDAFEKETHLFSLEYNAQCGCLLDSEIKQNCHPEGEGSAEPPLLCSGRGSCVCGRCVCQTYPNSTKMVMGDYCEYDNFSCDSPRCAEGPYLLNQPMTDP